jgi:hypothetical protein
MINPARRDIRLRLMNGIIERELPNQGWRSTGLSRDTVVSGGDDATLESLIGELQSAEDLETLSWSLRLTKQRAVGRNLYRGLFNPEGLGDPGRWLHLVPDKDDDFVDLFCRIPWCFLPREDDNASPFLMLDRNEAVSITIDAAPDRGHPEWFDEIKFPLHPRVLLVIPQVDDHGAPTSGKEHLAELTDALKASNPAFSSDLLLSVRTYAEFCKALESHDPHVIYFYGHGSNDSFHTTFQFEKGVGSADWRNFDECVVPLQNLLGSTQFPPVIWVNACQTGSAPQESALRMLAPLSCCTIATRTVIAVDDSRELARVALPLIVNGRAPHSAVRQAIHDSPPSVQCARWATTIVAVQFGIWSASAPQRRAGFKDFDSDSIGDFPRMLDRVRPLQGVEAFLKERIPGASEKPWSVLWHGHAEQGLDVFEERISESIRDIFPGKTVSIRNIELQADVAPNDPDALEQQFCESVFYGLKGMRKPTDEKGVLHKKRIQEYVTTAIGEDSLLVLLHAPLYASQIPLIKSYLNFWDDYFRALVLPKQEVVLGFGFVDASAPDLQLDSVNFLDSVPPGELDDHLWTFRGFYRGVPEKRDRVSAKAQSLVDEFNGRFERIHLKLEELAGFRRPAGHGEKGDQT